MTLAEQLYELRTNILRDRSDLIVGNDDSLWSDETLLNYIKDGERKFARGTLVIRDGTTPNLTRVKLKNGVKTYPLDKSILAVLSAKFNDRQSDLVRSGHAMVTLSQPTTYFEFNPLADYHIPPGVPVAYYTDETLVFNSQQGVNLSIYPVPGPNEDGLYVFMRVVRVPVTGYGLNCLERESEIPEDYQLDTLEWAAYRAQRTFDGDAGAPTSADAHAAAFAKAVTDCVRDMKRAEFAQIGFKYGRNGFSWTR